MVPCACTAELVARGQAELDRREREADDRRDEWARIAADVRAPVRARLEAATTVASVWGVEALEALVADLVPGELASLARILRERGRAA